MATPESPSAAVLEEVATREGVDPVALEPPLYEAVDPGALDALVAHARRTAPPSRCRVEFTYLGYDVAVNESGEVTVVDRDQVPSDDSRDG